MPRLKAISALAFFGVLISAGTVGSQDPLRARAEAESAETAAPITVSEPAFVAFPADTPANAAPQAITQPAQPLELAFATTASDASARIVPTQPATTHAIRPAVEGAAGALPDQLLTSDLTIPPDASTVATAARRLFATVPDDIEPYFDLFMYVSKSNRGPLAQRMYVFQRDGDGRIVPYAEWKVSTGREKIEFHNERKIRTTTPEGIFSLNPKRFYKRYSSIAWDGAPMNYAMFYDLLNNGNQTGLAIHAVSGRSKIRMLGRRDSAGCVRLAPKNAKELFYKVRNTTQGRVPVLALNARGSTDRWGRAERDDTGAMKLQDGYRALVFVENYDGRDELVSPVVAYTQ